MPDDGFRAYPSLRQRSADRIAAALQATEPPRRQAEEKQKRIAFLEKKLQTKDEVLAELMAEHIALKKSLGEA